MRAPGTLAQEKGRRINQYHTGADIDKVGDREGAERELRKGRRDKKGGEK